MLTFCVIFRFAVASERYIVEETRHYDGFGGGKTAIGADAQISDGSDFKGGCVEWWYVSVGVSSTTRSG